MGDEIKSIEKSITASTTVPPKPTPSSNSVPKKKYKAVQILRRLFTDNPSAEFSTSQTRDLLKEYLNRGELVSNAKDISKTNYAALRVLEKTKFISKSSDTGVLLYKLNKKEKGLLD